MKNIITMAVLFISLTISAQVGINNTSPKATLDITAKTTDGSKPEGLIAPRLKGNEIQSGTYGSDQKGAIIYATTAATAPNAVTINITQPGYYYFDGSVWQKIGSNIYNTDGTLTGTRTVNTAGNPLKISGGAPLVVQTDDNSGKIRLVPSDNSHTGYMEVVKGDNTRLGYIGWDNTNLNYVSENGANHVFQGGNIGVGTNYAGDKLYVAASANRQGVTVTNSMATAGTVTRLGIGGGTPTWGGINYTNIDNAGESRMSLGTYEGLEFLTVKVAGTNGGNVGIGTTSPSSKLDVNGGVKIGNDASTCSAANQGTLKYVGGQCYLCNGTSWSPFAIASPQVAVVKSTTGFPSATVMDENMTILSQQVPISTAGFTANSISATLGNDGVRDFIKLPAAGVYQINFSTFGSCNNFFSLSAGIGTALNISLYKAPNNNTYTLLDSYRSFAFTPITQPTYNTQLSASFVVSVSSNDKLSFQLDFIKNAGTGNTCTCGGIPTLPAGGTFTSQIIVNKL